MSILRSLVIMTLGFVSSASCAAVHPPTRMMHPQPNPNWGDVAAQRRQLVYNAPTAQELAQQKIMQSDEEAIRLNRLLVTLGLEMQVMELMQDMKKMKDNESKTAAKKKQNTFVGTFIKKVEAAGMEVVCTATKWGIICYILKVAGGYYGKEATRAAARLAFDGVQGAVNVVAGAGEVVFETAKEQDSWWIWGAGSVLSPVWRVVAFPFVS